MAEATATQAPVAATPTPNGATGAEAPTPPKPNILPPPPQQTPEERAQAQRLAALVKREKQLNAIRTQTAAEKEEAAKMRAEAAEVRKQLAEAKRNPLAAMRALGLTYEDLTNAQLADGKPSPELLISSVRDELESFKKQTAEERAQLLKEREAALDAERHQALSTFRAEVVDYVKSKSDEFEYTNLLEAQGLVSKYIESHHAETGELLTIQDAAVKVEAHLEAQAEKQRAAKKFQAKTAAPVAPGSSKPAASGSAQPRTLSNDMTVSASALNGSAARSEKERIERALAALSK